MAWGWRSNIAEAEAREGEGIEVRRGGLMTGVAPDENGVGRDLACVLGGGTELERALVGSCCWWWLCRLLVGWLLLVCGGLAGGCSWRGCRLRLPAFVCVPPGLAACVRVLVCYIFKKKSNMQTAFSNGARSR